MDALEKMLIEQYGLSPEKAKVYAQEINANRAPEGNTIAGKAYGDVAHDERTRMAELKRKFELFTKIADDKRNGLNVSPEHENFYKTVASKALKSGADRAAKAKRDTDSMGGNAAYTAGLAGAGQAGQATEIQMPPMQMQQPQMRNGIPQQQMPPRSETSIGPRPQGGVQQVPSQAITAPIGGGQTMTIGQQPAPQQQVPAQPVAWKPSPEQAMQMANSANQAPSADPRVIMLLMEKLQQSTGMAATPGEQAGTAMAGGFMQGAQNGMR